MPSTSYCIPTASNESRQSRLANASNTASHKAVTASPGSTEALILLHSVRFQGRTFIIPPWVCVRPSSRPRQRTRPAFPSWNFSVTTLRHSSVLMTFLHNSCLQDLHLIRGPVVRISLDQAHPLHHSQSTLNPPKYGMLPI